VTSTSSFSEKLFVVIQAFIVSFLLLHDWIPLGTLNDLEGVRVQNTTQRLVIQTAVNTFPTLIGFLLSLKFIGKKYPLWFKLYMTIMYTCLFAGELYAWWIPYFFGADEHLVERYSDMFANTHAFLPMMNGIVPNTLHVILHLLTLFVLILSFYLSFFKKKKTQHYISF
jgi:hypothetical protein